MLEFDVLCMSGGGGGKVDGCILIGLIVTMILLLFLVIHLFYNIYWISLTLLASYNYKDLKQVT